MKLPSVRTLVRSLTVFLVITVSYPACAQSVPGDRSHDLVPMPAARTAVQKSEIDKLVELDDSIEQIIYRDGRVYDKCNHIITSMELKNAKMNLRNSLLAQISLVIAFLSMVGTCGTLIYQGRLSKRQKRDISNERFENNLNIQLQRYDRAVSGFEIKNVCKGRFSFNFLFYEYKLLYEDFCGLELKSRKTNEPLHAEYISSLAVSFVVSGLTANSDGGRSDIVYGKYAAELSPADYEKLKAVVMRYKRIGDTDLIRLADPLSGRTLFINYAPVKLSEGREVRWFWGIRPDFIPYVKIIRSALDYIAGFVQANRLSEKEADRYFRMLESSFSEHELGLLYAFVCSHENREYIGIPRPEAERLIALSQLPDLYNFRKWKC